MILSVHRAGSPQFPRYFISDQFNRVWTGDGWSEDERNGLLYGDSPEACIEVQRLLQLEYMDKPMRRFRAPVYLDLFADESLPTVQIVRWLAKASRLLIDSPEQGNGPAEGTLGLVRIEWGEIQEVKE
ncbi:MAG TPA: hypothetical protein PKD86_00090 [Gemmatales bacterium]|nr:hypothetical protein [Gemmatales bacterium]